MFEEIKTLGKHTLIYGSGIFLGKAISFFMIPLYTHFLSPKDYGVLELLDLTGYIISYFLVLGLNEATLRYYSYYDDPKDKNAVISTNIIFILFYASVFVFFLFNFSDTFSKHIFGSELYKPLFALLFISLLFGSVNNICTTTLRAQQRSVYYTALSITKVILAISLNIYFVALLKLGVKGILYSTIITSGLLGFYLIFTILSQVKFSFQISYLIKMLKYGLPFIPTEIAMFILNWSDRYFLRIYNTVQSIGIYALAYKIAMIIVVLVTHPFNLVWAAYMFEIEKKQNSKELYARIATYYMFVLILIGLFLCVYAKEIITIIAPPSYLKAYKVIPLLVMSMIFMTSVAVLRTGILVTRKTSYLPIMVGLAAIINIFLNFLLIPKYEIEGAAIATAISFFVRAFGIYLISQWLYSIPFEYSRIFKLILAAIIIFEISSLFSIDSLWLSIVIKSSILCLFPIILYILKFLTTEETTFLKNRLRMLHHLVLQNSKKYF